MTIRKEKEPLVTTGHSSTKRSSSRKAAIRKKSGVLLVKASWINGRRGLLGRRSGAGGCQRLHFRRDLGHADGDSGDQGRHFVDAELGNPGLLEQRIGEALGAETERERERRDH